MSSSIQLSLAGDGRLVILTPKTVRQAFFQFTKINSEYTKREKYRLEYPVYDLFQPQKKIIKKSIKDRTTIIDALHRSYLDKENANNLKYLCDRDIRKVERQINRYILDYDLALVKDEGKLLKGYDICQQAGKNRQKVQYILRYGMFFIVEPIDRQTAIKMRNVDLFIQDKTTYDFHLVRYSGILLSSLKSQIQLLFAHRLDFSRQWTRTLEQFQPRQILRVIGIYPCPGFCLKSV